MNPIRFASGGCILLLAAWITVSPAHAGAPAQSDATSPRVFGPYHGVFIPGGLGLRKPMPAADAPVAPASEWTIFCWLRGEGLFPARTLVAGFGELNGDAGSQRYLGIEQGHPAFWFGGDEIAGRPILESGKWYFFAATFDGTAVRLFLDGTEIAGQAVPNIVDTHC